MARVRSSMAAPTLSERLAPVTGQRLLEPGDGEAWGTLLYLAYHGTADDDGETLEDGLAVGPGLVAADRPNLVRSCSTGIWRDDRLVSGIMILTIDADHWIDPIVTHPDYKRTGLARHLICWASGELHALGVRRFRLAVTDANTPAVSLYRKLGFSREGPWPR